MLLLYSNYSADSDDPAALGLFMVIGGIVGFFTGFSRLKRKRMIENIPTSTVRGMAMGEVELAGQAEHCHQALTAPFSNSPCVYYKYKIEEYHSNGKNSHWDTIAKGESTASPFYLKDDTGRVLVSPAKAEMVIDQKLRTESMNPQIENFLTRSGLRSRGLFGFQRRLRFTEWHIKPNEKVYVLGFAQKNQTFLQDHRAKLAERLEKAKQDRALMAQFDMNKDGEISQEEWNFAAQSIEQQLLEDLSKSSFTHEEHTDVVIAFNPNSRIFIISDKDQKELLSKLGWQCGLAIYGGAASVIIGLIILVLRFNLL